MEDFEVAVEGLVKERLLCLMRREDGAYDSLQILWRALSTDLIN
jgi:hypothetical protein